MSDRLTSWLAKAVIQHDRQHGANLSATRTGAPGWLVQIIDFYNWRSTADPRAQIRGIVGDKTHHLQVEFDVDATDRYEAADTDLPSEPLASCKRALLAIKSYRWKLASPSRRRSADGKLELPIVIMEILDFDVKEGDRFWPNLLEEPVDIGRGEHDGEVQKVLRKWYFGESHSDLSQVDKSFEYSQPTAGPSKLSASSPAGPIAQSRLPPEIIPLSTFLEPYISEAGAKKGKPIPDWVFDMSDENRQALDEVRMFGLDFDESPPTVSSPVHQAQPSPSRSESPLSIAEQEPSSPILHVDKGKQKALPLTISPQSDRVISPAARPPSVDKGKQKDRSSGHSPRSEDRMPSATQYATPPVPLGQIPRSPQTATQLAHDSPGADGEDEDEESSDGEIPIRPLTRVYKTQRRPIFDPLDFHSHDRSEHVPILLTQNARLAPAERAQVDQKIENEAESTDSDMLSEYERSRRSKRQDKKRRVDQSLVDLTSDLERDPIVLDVSVTQSAVELVGVSNNRDDPIVIDDESIPASESLESYSLSKQYPSPPKPDITKLQDNLGSSILAVSAAPEPRLRQVNTTAADTHIDDRARSPSPALLPLPTARRPSPTHDPDSLGSSKTGSGNTQSLPTPPPSDDQDQGQEDRAFTRPSEAPEPKPVRLTLDAPSRPPARVSIKREPEPRTDSSPRGPPPAAATAAMPLRSALSSVTHWSGRREIVLDLTVDGLSEDTVQQYITRIIAAREKQRSRAN